MRHFVFAICVAALLGSSAGTLLAQTNCSDLTMSLPYGGPHTTWWCRPAPHEFHWDTALIRVKNDAYGNGYICVWADVSSMWNVKSWDIFSYTPSRDDCINTPARGYTEWGYTQFRNDWRASAAATVYIAFPCTAAQSQQEGKHLDLLWTETRP